MSLITPSSVHAAGQPAEVLNNPVLAACWALPAWTNLPYRSVEVFLPRGSSFTLCGPDLAYQAARRLQLPGVALLTHVEEQVLPMLNHSPEMLLDIARRLPWEDVRAMARGAFWHSYKDTQQQDFPGAATLILSSKRGR